MCETANFKQNVLRKSSNEIPLSSSAINISVYLKKSSIYVRYSVILAAAQSFDVNCVCSSFVQILRRHGTSDIRVAIITVRA